MSNDPFAAMRIHEIRIEGQRLEQAFQALPLDFTIDDLTNALRRQGITEQSYQAALRLIQRLRAGAKIERHVRVKGLWRKTELGARP